MEFHHFEFPLMLHTKHSFARTISTVSQALAFLTICEMRHRNAEFYIALGACHAAADRVAPAQWAREAFRQFAAQRNMLMLSNRREPVDLDALLGETKALAGRAS
ncbi:MULTISPECIES: DUF982 domain-containing protein [unclassified Aureimonas]|uniref:DUF982 domain-containing protein n=1 Tax=unclassified Aureimonas TaxID=2615206 RepID=UPI0006F909CC|nr:MULTISPECIES: DUF982 domain-containing protein [unclassified Aureimonas]KQT60373.1 hypothetical protein ASG62_06865 [Aureimonas sp. Leaf427]KQT79251.1 hypothetical protein ASG54_09465 [Aureimonas sp. Leaf460]